MHIWMHNRLVISHVGWSVGRLIDFLFNIMNVILQIGLLVGSVYWSQCRYGDQ